MTVVNYFHNNLMYLDSLEPYIDELDKKLHRQKRISERNAKGQSFEKQIDTAQSLYDDVMMWDVHDFGSIIRNQGFFQRGIIHNIVDETDFKWKVGEEIDEHN
jgi:TPP-dependent 2-oxoacid decarboxylase